MASFRSKAIPAHRIYRQREDRMNLPDAPIAHEGFFATHFFA
jgi:hypothetical protein